MSRWEMSEVVVSKLKKGEFDIDAALDSVDLAFRNYKPSQQAFEFFALIRVFYGEDFEIASPKFHYFIVDMLFGNVTKKDFPYSAEICDKIKINPTRIGIIASRGTAKSTVTTLFYPIYAAIKGETPVTGKLSHMLILSDSQKGGARDQALIMGNTFEKSKFAKEWFESIRYTESEVEIVRKGNTPIEQRHMLIKFKGAQGHPLDHMLFTDNGRVSVGDVQIGDKIVGADGKLCAIVDKSEIFYKPMYEIELKDGRKLQVSDDHINSVLYKDTSSKYTAMDITTKELLKLPMWIHNKATNRNTPRIWIKNCEPIDYTYKEFPVDPYTLGLVLGDGYYHKSDYSVKLTGNKEDIEFYKTQVPYEFGYNDSSRSAHTVTLKGVYKGYQELGLSGTKAASKFIPEMYKYGSIRQRLALLQGLIDTDGTVAAGNKGVRFMTVSTRLADDVAELVLSLGGNVTSGIRHRAGTETAPGIVANYDLHMLYIKLNMQVARLPRKVSKLSYAQRDCKVAVVSIKEIATVPSQCIAVDNEKHQYLVQNYVRTHNTGGIRSGSRNPVTGDRYAIIVADDVIKNEAEAYSETIMHNVNTALTSDALNAMRSKKTQLVLINTPFHKKDPIYTMVESGMYTPLVIPICKKIDENLEPVDFEGVWTDMHDYDSVMERYLNAKGSNSTRSFNQELMLRVANEEDRMVTDTMIQWYDRNLIMSLLDGYSLYVTTDFTTTSAAKSDFSALAVWAISSNNDYFLLDVCVRRQELGEQYNELFRMVRTWSKGGRYVEVGIEVDGQQKAHLFNIKQMMQKQNLYFSFARQKGAPAGREGILSAATGTNKLERFRYILPKFQNMKFYFPEQLKGNKDMQEGLKQIKGATHAGFTSADDFCDCVSQLEMMDVREGSGVDDLPYKETGSSKSIWGDMWDKEDTSGSSVIF